MLSREQKRKILNSYSLFEYKISYDRYNYKYKNKVIAREFSHTGNGYICGKELNDPLKKYEIDNRGWINIKDMNEEELRTLIELVIDIFGVTLGERTN
ncbi:hypothetical protein [Niallia sp. FSL R7-0271]|uniref:hypothetical protein n=1 Tax=Niallia sp. FSL R7-0271 TaxID=2921678 RepID=UPI0030F85C42